MIVKKILNNNLILASDQDGSEQIVMGKGLRFMNQVGEELKETNIEKIYVLKDENNTRNYMRLVEEAPPEYVESVQEAVRLANEWSKSELNEQLFVTLFDHLIYALERQEKGIVLQNRMLWEIKQFYPKEYEVGLRVLKFLNDELSCNLPEQEAGNIAFHLVNAATDHPNMEDTIVGIRMQKDIFNIIQVAFQKKIDTESMNYTRFVIHIQFFLQRLFDDKLLSDNGIFLYEQVEQKLPKELKCARQIKQYIKKNLKKEITQEELVYLAVHISRIISRAD
ncbi:MAG: PRD domain-containing protein [Lachnospiraceae bacterium]|nr:PRD domain-containing protein [Lachnospiraceae bacterium]